MNLEMDDMFMRTPEDILDRAWEHIDVRHALDAFGAYESGDILAMSILDAMRAALNPYPFMGKRRAN